MDSSWQNAQNHRVAAGEYRLKNSRTATPVHFFVMRGLDYGVKRIT
jgi:hypothetical protein